MVGGRYIPVEVVLIEYINDFVVRNECNLLGIESGEETWRKVFVEGSCFSDGENELDERVVDIVVASLFGFRPKEELGVEERGIVLRNGDGKVDVAKYIGSVVVGKEIFSDPKFEFFFSDVEGV